MNTNRKRGPGKPRLYDNPITKSVVIEKELYDWICQQFPDKSFSRAASLALEDYKATMQRDAGVVPAGVS